MIEIWNWLQALPMKDWILLIFIIVIFAMAIAVLAKICYNHGKMVWSVRCALMEDQYKKVRRCETMLLSEKRAHYVTKAALREEVRNLNNHLQAIWVSCQTENIHCLQQAIEHATKDHTKFIPDPISKDPRLWTTGQKW